MVLNDLGIEASILRISLQLRYMYICTYFGYRNPLVSFNVDSELQLESQFIYLIFAKKKDLI